MKKYEGKTIYAFTSLDGSNIAHGNPGLVVFGNPNEEERILISKNATVELNNEYIKLPIIVFVNPVDIENNLFDIRYYFCTGKEMNICGHGTICAVKAIIEKYDKKHTKQFYNFNLNQDFKENQRFPLLKIESDGNYFITELDDVNFEEVAKDNEIRKIIKRNLPSVIEETIYKSELRDYIFVCKDPKELRKTIIPLEELQNIRKIDSTYRGLFTVAISDKEGYDYETTVISDELPAPVYKDPACGSANKEILKLLRITNTFPNRFKKGDIENFRMYYPYRSEELGILGGIQDIEYHYKIGKIFVKSGAKFGKNIEIEINNNFINFI